MKCMHNELGLYCIEFRDGVESKYPSIVFLSIYAKCQYSMYKWALPDKNPEDCFFSLGTCLLIQNRHLFTV